LNKSIIVFFEPKLLNGNVHCGYLSKFDVYIFNFLFREVQVLEAQAATGLVEGTSGEGQSGVVASTALIEKTLSEDPRWQGEISLYACMHTHTRLKYELK